MPNFARRDNAGASFASNQPSITFNVTPNPGDLLVAFVAIAAAAQAMAANTGWTILTVGTSTRRGALYWKIAGAGESATQQPTDLWGTSRNGVILGAIYTGSNGLSAAGGNVFTADNDATKTITAALDPPDGVERLLIGAAFVDSTAATWSAQKFNGSTSGVTELADVANASSVTACLFDKVESPTVAGNYTAEAVSSVSAAGGVFLALFSPAVSLPSPRPAPRTWNRRRVT